MSEHYNGLMYISVIARARCGGSGHSHAWNTFSRDRAHFTFIFGSHNLSWIFVTWNSIWSKILLNFCLFLSEFKMSIKQSLNTHVSRKLRHLNVKELNLYGYNHMSTSILLAVLFLSKRLFFSLSYQYSSSIPSQLWRRVPPCHLAHTSFSSNTVLPPCSNGW